MPFHNLTPSSGYAPPKVPARPAVAIPRVQKAEQGRHATVRRRRVLRACLACRGQKMRCSGVSPVCERCATNNTRCVYNLPRKDRLKIMIDICDSMADTMRGMYPSANEDDKRRIERDLNALEEASSTSQARPITSSMTDTTSSNSPEIRDSHGIYQQQDVRGQCTDAVPEYVGAMPAFLTGHTTIGIPTGYSIYEELLENPSADYLGNWDLGDAYPNYQVDESERQTQRGE